MQSCHVHSNTCAPSLSLTWSCRTTLPHFEFVPWGSDICFFVGCCCCLIIPFLAMIAGAWTCACPVYCSTSPPTLIANKKRIHSRCLTFPTYYARTRLQIARTCSDTTCRERNHTFAFRVRGSSHVQLLLDMSRNWCFPTCERSVTFTLVNRRPVISPTLPISV